MESKENLISFNEYTLANRYPIHGACRDGDLSALNELLERVVHNGGENGALFCEDSFYGWMPIHWAAYRGHLGCIRTLLAFTSSGRITHVEHVRDGNEVRSTQTWNALVDAQASNFRQTPIHLAAYGNHVECIKWLLNAGASPHITDSLGETSAHKAARCGGLECLGVLAAHDVNLSVVNNAGQTAADVAAACGHSRCSAYLQRCQNFQNGGSAGVVASTGGEVSNMDIDQNDHQSVFVNGMYGYQPFYASAQATSNGRKRSSVGDCSLENDKRYKKAWKKDDDGDVMLQQRRHQVATCTMTTAKSWVSGHCLM